MANTAKPPAANSGPTISGIFPPCRATIPPDHRDNRNISKISGRLAAPADVAEYPYTCINAMGNKKKKTPIAAYKKNGKMFAPRNERDLNKSSETIGGDARDSTHKKT